MAWIEHRYDDSEALASAVASVLETATRNAITERGTALLALAGGRTPLPAYAQFASLALQWRDVVLMPTDERCVPDSDAASNIAELRRLFFGCAGLQLESLTTSNGEPEASVRQARTMLARHAGPFDAVVLGMGADGHTASLFPGAPQLEAGLDPSGVAPAVRIDPKPLPVEAPFPRITLSAARLTHAREMHLIVTGAGKQEVLLRAYDRCDPLQLPISAFLHAPGTLVHVHWSP